LLLCSKNVICNGESDGTITVTVTSGEGPYTYALSGTTTNTTGDASGVYTGLPVGSYVVTVRNGRVVYRLQLQYQLQPTLLTATAAALNTTCSNTTVITVTASQDSSINYEQVIPMGFNGLSYTSDNTR
jgi:hypothetical protein